MAMTTVGWKALRRRSLRKKTACRICAVLAASAALLFSPALAWGAEAPISRSASEGATLYESLSVPEATHEPMLGEALQASNGNGAIATQASSYAPTFIINAIGNFHQTEARKLLDLVNQARAREGVRPLAYDTNLEDVAMLRAAECQMSFSHTRPNGWDCFTAADQLGVNTGWTMGENIAAGYSNAAATNQQWTNSAGHYRNMVNPNFTSFGVAAFEMNGWWCWVEFFGATQGTGFNTAALDGTYMVTTDAQVAFLPLIYEDVNPSDWYVAKDGGENFCYVINTGLMSGYGNRPAFGPYDSVTRGQVATILWRMAGEPIVSSADFSDVNYGEFYGQAIRWARATGVVSGYGDTNTFGPDEAVTREQLCVMLANYASRIAGLDVSSTMAKASSMPDWGQVSSWSREAMGWALDEGIMSGVEVSKGYRELKPKDSAQRCQLATMVAVFHRDILN